MDGQTVVNDMASSQHEEVATLSPPPSCLLALPSELRLMVYEHLLPSRIGPGEHIGLLQSCRLLRHEYVPEALKDIRADFDFYCSKMCPKEVDIISSLHEALTTSNLELRIWKPDGRVDLWKKRFREILDIDFPWISQVRITIEEEEDLNYVSSTPPISFWLLRTILNDLSEPLYESHAYPYSQFRRPSHIKKLVVTWRNLGDDPLDLGRRPDRRPQEFLPRYTCLNADPRSGPQVTAVRDDFGKYVAVEWTCR